MLELYRAVADCDPNKKNVVVTVLDGDSFGEKALLSDGQLVWESVEGGYFSARFAAVWDTLLDPAQSRKGVISLDGIRVFGDWLGQEMKLVICGAGHVSMPVIRIGKMMDCHVTVLEDRPLFADNARRAGADVVLCDSFAHGLDQVEGGSSTYFVIGTRGHRYDQVCLEKIVRKDHAYIGMIGSRRRVAAVKEMVLEQGGDPEVLENVYTPIGLDIGAETPTEIGVAIMGEIIQVKNKTKRTCGYSKEIMHEILSGEENDGRKVLATIVTRRGSAPRDAGTKMLVLPDGRCIGTIGGGCMEANIMRKALSMSRGGNALKLCHVDMTGEDAEDEGMVCGGVVDVLLECI